MVTATKDCICPVCEQPIKKGDRIRFASYTVTKHQPISGRGYDVQRWRPKHAHNCHVDVNRRMYLALNDERMAEVDASEESMLRIARERGILTEQRLDQLLAYCEGKRAALREERAHINQHGHPYPKAVK